MAIYYEFEVDLIDVKPRVWRRFLLKETLSFAALHDAIQDACAWENAHLFEFCIGTKHNRPVIAASPYAIDDLHPEYNPTVAGRKKLRSFFEDNSECVYIYDFGDGWQHRVKKIGKKEVESSCKRILTGGKRAFPLEDSGGLPGYDECVKISSGLFLVEDENMERREWIGDWHPELFDLQQTKTSFDR